MKGIYFINDRITINGLTNEESFRIQERSIQYFMQTNKIQEMKLNPYQLYNYYTNPHALLYDLKKTNQQVDYFISYSEQMTWDFIHTYPARWLVLKSFFNEMITIQDQIETNNNRVVWFHHCISRLLS